VCFQLLYKALVPTHSLLIAAWRLVFSLDKSQMRKKRKTPTMVKKITTTRTAMTTVTTAIRNER
jgi:hypothetical protein